MTINCIFLSITISQKLSITQNCSWKTSHCVTDLRGKVSARGKQPVSQERRGHADEEEDSGHGPAACQQDSPQHPEGLQTALLLFLLIEEERDGFHSIF